MGEKTRKLYTLKHDSVLDGVETVIEGFDNVWQIIGAVSGGSTQAMSMDITSMCNINLIFFIVAVFVCLFVGEDFRSGYAKNLFTVRSKKDDYIISKSIVCSCLKKL